MRLWRCLKNNICVFQNAAYMFPDSFPMGGPLLSLVADVFMDTQEQLFFNSDPLSPHVRYWVSYVDNVLCVWHRFRITTRA